MYPTSNANNNAYVEQVAAQPMYQPAPYAQNVSSQPRIDNSQVVNDQSSLDAPQPCPPPQYPEWSQSTYNPQGVANPLIRQPMMHSFSHGGHYAPVYQYAPQQQMPMNMGYPNAPVYNGQNATNLRVDIPPVVPQNAPILAQSGKKQHQVEQAVSDKPDFKKLPLKTQEFLRALENVQQGAKVSSPEVEVAKTSEKAPELREETNSSSIQKHFEQHMAIQKRLIEALQPKPFPRFSLFDAAESYEIAMSRLEAMKPNVLQTAEKNASMVFIYDIEDITQLTYDTTRAVRRMFPDLKTTANIIGNLSFWLSKKFFEYNKDQDCNMTVMNVKDGHFGTKISEYLEFKNKCETSGSNVVYELIKVYEDDKDRKEDDSDHEEEDDDDTEENAEPKVTLAQAVAFQKLFKQPWKSARKCLQATTDKSLKNTYDNVVLCSGIGDGAAELLISGLASDVPLENIYSTSRSSKEEVLERIQRDYGDDCVLVVVTSNTHTIDVAEKQNILVWPIEDAKSLDALRAAQKLHFLK